MPASKQKPTTVKIGPHVYTVVDVERLQAAGNHQSLYGQINYPQQTIEVEKNLIGTYKRMVIWHEIIHGILETAGIHEHDEQLLDAVASGIVQVLQDNAWLRQ